MFNSYILFLRSFNAFICLGSFPVRDFVLPNYNQLMPLIDKPFLWMKQYFKTIFRRFFVVLFDINFWE